MNKEQSSTDTLSPKTSTGGTLVLQWLTYAFWGWFIASLIWLLGIIFTSIIVGDTVNATIPYAIAAVIVLLPLAFVCDLFYRRHEPLRKAGAAMVIMLIHAVLFALSAIGALIIAVFTGLNSIINATDDSSSVTSVVVYTAASAAVLYGLAFLRTLNPFKHKKGAVIYAWSMLGVAIALLIAAVAGPVVQSVSTRNDRLIEDSIANVHYGVQRYVSNNGVLPENLDQIKTYSERADEVIANGDLEYINEGEAPASLEAIDDMMSNGSTQTTYRYQLCATYDQESKGDKYESSYEYDSKNGYSSYPRATPHDAGRVCYKLYVQE